MAERGRAPGRTQGYAGTWPPREAARAGGFAPSGFGEWSSLLETLRAWVRAEAGAGRLLPWVPIAFGAGIAFYFGADHEPVAWVTAVAAIAFCAAAARGGGAGQLRFRPGHVFRRYRRLRFCHRRRQDRGAAGRWRSVTALRRLHAGFAGRNRRANTQRPGWRPARHRHRAVDRPPRRDLHACQRCDVHFRARPRAVDFRIPHSAGPRRGVLRGPRAPGADPGADRRLSDQG